jgi:hypothetical protein
VLQYRFAPAPSDTARQNSESNWVTLATGSTSVTSNALAPFDPTMLLNGIYQLRLTAVDSSGRTTTTDPISVVVDRNLKIGQFTISFNDVTVPAAGIPIQITRTYDSRAAAAGIQGDFGIGWTLDLLNIRLQKKSMARRARHRPVMVTTPSATASREPSQACRLRRNRSPSIRMTG